jgi:polysaccharide deacetylase 2 family uncharacterized protein YibQ
LNRQEEIYNFIQKVRELEEEYGVKIVTDDQEAELMYQDLKNNQLYYLEDEVIKKW